MQVALNHLNLLVLIQCQITYINSNIFFSNDDFGERTVSRGVSGGAQAPAAADSGFLPPAPPKSKSKFMFKSSGSASSCIKLSAVSEPEASNNSPPRNFAPREDRRERPVKTLEALRPPTTANRPEASNNSPPRNLAPREDRRVRQVKPVDALRPPTTANRPLAPASASTTPQQRQLNSAAAVTPVTPSGGDSSGILLSSLGQATQKTASASQV